MMSGPATTTAGLSGGTGAKLANATIIVSGVCSLVATLVSLVSIWLQSKNYRKPLLQRYVVRILVMVPIYAIASWSSLISLKVAFWVDPIRDIYEAFTIYTFFQLLINYMGGERSLIIMMHGRAPVNHLWPLDHLLPKVDISDPYTFLAIKRGILQYAWLKPLLAVASFIMKATGTYQEGYVGLRSGYFWSGLIYNISVTISLYSLGMFWVCMSHDLKPFRPVPKFLCIKLLIFASYWQGFFLSILVWLGALPDTGTEYTPDNIAAAIQDALICCELPAFAIAHWYAFSWHDYDDRSISSARMTVKYALRDAFGVRDLIEDTKETFGGKNYDYREFDSGDHVLAHEESSSREARILDGMRYQRFGKGKYWIPPPSASTNSSRTPLLQGQKTAKPFSPSESREREAYGTDGSTDDAPIDINEEDEALFTDARALEFGDWNYPVVVAHRPTRADLTNRPDLLTTSANRRILKPAKQTKAVKEAKDGAHHGKPHGKGKEAESSSRNQSPKGGDGSNSASGSSSPSDSSQLVDLVVEDYEGEETERVRARREGGSQWDDPENPPRRFIKTYPSSEEGEETRTGFDEPPKTPPVHVEEHATNETDPAHQDAIEDVWRAEDERERAARDGGKQKQGGYAFENVGESDVWKDH